MESITSSSPMLSIPTAEAPTTMNQMIVTPQFSLYSFSSLCLPKKVGIYFYICCFTLTELTSWGTKYLET